MTMFTYNNDVPFSTNNPSNDQPPMLLNTKANFGIWDVDHVGFNSTGIIGNPQASGGQHLQVTFNGKNVPAYNPLDPLSVLYANNIIGAADFHTASASDVSQLFYLNQSGNQLSPLAPTPFPISMIKAFGCFDNTGNSLNAWNMVLLSPDGHPTAGTYIFTMPIGCCNSVKYLVMITAQLNVLGGSQPLAYSYIINSETQFTVQFKVSGSVLVADPSQFSIIVMQL